MINDGAEDIGVNYNCGYEENSGYFMNDWVEIVAMRKIDACLVGR